MLLGTLMFDDWTSAAAVQFSLNVRCWHQAAARYSTNVRTLLEAKRTLRLRCRLADAPLVTPSSHKPKPNPALQRAPDLILANAVRCHGVEVHPEIPEQAKGSDGN